MKKVLKSYDSKLRISFCIMLKWSLKLQFTPCLPCSSNKLNVCSVRGLQLLHSHLTLHFRPRIYTGRESKVSENWLRSYQLLSVPLINSYYSNDAKQFQKVNIRDENPRIFIKMKPLHWHLVMKLVKIRKEHCIRSGKTYVTYYLWFQFHLPSGANTCLIYLARLP